MRWVSTRVLPEPAPATTSSGPPRWTTASSWSGFRPRSSAGSRSNSVIPRPILRRGCSRTGTPRRQRHGQGAERGAEHAGPCPAALFVRCSAGRRAQRAAEEVGRHVHAVDPAAGLGRQLVDHGLVEDLRCPARRRRARGRRRRSGTIDVRPGHSTPNASDEARRRRRAAPVGSSPRSASRPAAMAHSAPPPRRARAARSRRRSSRTARSAEEERDGRPEHAERGEAQRPERRPSGAAPARCGRARSDEREEVAVAHPPDAGSSAGSRDASTTARADVARRRARTPPASRRRRRPGRHGPAEQDAEEQARS